MRGALPPSNSPGQGPKGPWTPGFKLSVSKGPTAFGGESARGAAPLSYPYRAGIRGISCATPMATVRSSIRG